MAQIALIYTLFANELEASDICREMLLHGVVACANRMAPVTSHYMWEGKMQTQQEYPVIMKTSLDQMEPAMEMLKAIHSYDTPPVTGWPADASPDFGQWVDAETRQREKLA